MSDNKKTPPSSIKAEDFDKTLVDVDVRKLEAEDLDKTQIIGRKKSPPPPEPAPVKKTEKKIESAATKKESASPTVSTASSPSSEPRFNFKENALALLIWILLSCFQLGLLVDALGNASPLRVILGFAFSFNLFFFVFSFLRKISLNSAANLGAAIVLFVLSYASYRYGSLDPLALTAFKKVPASLFNLLFLFSIVYFQYRTVVSKAFSKPVKIVLSSVLFYALLGILENYVYAFVVFKSFWNLEDNLNSSLFAFPFFLKPLIIYFYLVLPLCFFASLFKILKSKNEIFSSFFQLLLCFSLLLFSQVILLKNSYPSFLSILGQTKESTGMTFVNADENSNIQIQTANYSKLKSNDLILQQKIAASSQVLSQGTNDSNRKINLLIRNEEGRQLPFENKKHLQILEQNSPIQNFTLSSLQRNSLTPKNLFFLYTSTPSFNAYTNSLKEALKQMSQALNTKEKIYLGQASDSFKGLWLNDENLKNLKVQVSNNTNVKLLPAFEGWSKEVQSERVSKVSFLLATSDFLLSEEEKTKLLASLKKQKSVLFVFCLENACSPSLKDLAEQSGGKSITLSSKQEWSPVFLSAFGSVFPDYQLSYVFQGTDLDFQIISPANDVLINEDTTLDLRLASAANAGSKIVLSVQDKILQEQVLNADLTQKIALNLTQFPKGKNTFKVTLLDAQGRQASKELSLDIPEVKKISFVRPLDGDTISGQQNLELFIRDSLQPLVSKVEFFIEDQKIGESLTEPYLITWDTQSQIGTRLLKSIVTLNDGSTLQDQVKVNVTSSSVISTKILSPALGEYLNVLTEIEAEVTHPLSENIEKVEFMADGVLLGTANQAPFKNLWYNSTLRPGKHYIQARAYSKLGSATDSVSVNIGSGTLSVLSGDNSNSMGSGLSPDAFEWVLDASKTMGASVGGSKKIDWVKNALSEVFPKISSTSQHAFRWMGSQNPSSFQDCKDTTQPYTSFKTMDTAKLQSQLAALNSKGIAPLAYTLEKIRSDLKASAGSRVVVLFTDGYENCGGDPVLELERWKKEKMNVKLYILGLDLEGSRDEIELKRIASIVGGEYVSISHPQDLSKALEEVIKVNYAVFDYKGKEVAQKPVGSEPLILRTGEYRVEVNLEPPLVQEKVLLLNGLEKKLFLKKEASQFRLSE